MSGGDTQLQQKVYIVTRGTFKTIHHPRGKKEEPKSIWQRVKRLKRRTDAKWPCDRGGCGEDFLEVGHRGEGMGRCVSNIEAVLRRREAFSNGHRNTYRRIKPRLILVDRERGGIWGKST